MRAGLAGGRRAKQDSMPVARKGGWHKGGRSTLCLSFFDQHIHPPILLPPLRIIAPIRLRVRRNRVMEAAPLHLHIGEPRLALGFQPPRDRPRTAAGEIHVVSIGADAVRVADNSKPARMRLENELRELDELVLPIRT